MAEQVPTSGFAVPPVPQQQSLNPQPAPTGLQGIVPPQPAPQEPAPQQAPAPQQNAELLELLQGFLQQQAEPQQAAPAATVEPQEFNGSEIAEMAEDDPLANSMLSILQASAPSMDIDRFMGKALVANDVSLLDVAYLQEKFPQQAQHLLTIARGLVEHSKAQGARRQAAVYQTAGGKENWDAAAAAFKQGAPAAIKQIAQLLFERGQDAAGAQLVVGFAQRAGAVLQPGTFVQGGGAAPGGQALDKATFQAELRKLNPQAPGFEQQRAELFARRQQGKQLGR